MVGDLEKANMVLRPNKLTMKQEADMTLFHMDRWDLTFRNVTAPEDGVRMTLVLRRKIMGEIMTTYFPSLLLLMITFATTFFKPFFFEAALTVNLTNMLVMTTIFISVMEKLPHTSYTKLVDYWLIFCQLVPFAEVILLTAREYIRDKEEDEKKEASTQTLQESNDYAIEIALSQKQEAWICPSPKNPKRIKWAIGRLNTLGKNKHSDHVLSF